MLKHDGCHIPLFQCDTEKTCCFWLFSTGLACYLESLQIKKYALKKPRNTFENSPLLLTLFPELVEKLRIYE